MYNAKYITQISINPYGEREEKSRLVAKFKFNEEVAPKDRKEILEKIKEVKKESIYLYKNSFGLNFEVLCKSEEAKLLPEESMLNALNNYVLTGKDRDKCFVKNKDKGCNLLFCKEF